MPFKSKKQARYMFAKHPKIAKEFASKTKSIKKLPERKKKYDMYNRVKKQVFKI